LTEADPDSFWRWAAANWRTEKIPRRKAMPE
jgi:hypothetical protein